MLYLSLVFSTVLIELIFFSILIFIVSIGVNTHSAIDQGVGGGLRFHKA